MAKTLLIRKSQKRGNLSSMSYLEEYHELLKWWETEKIRWQKRKEVTKRLHSNDKNNITHKKEKEKR